MCGDRKWVGLAQLTARMETLPMDTVVIHGDASGADRMAGNIAVYMGLKVEVYPAGWKQYGRAAGPIRNCAMLASGLDLVIACHSDLESSKGTKDMVNRALQDGVPVEYIV